MGAIVEYFAADPLKIVYLVGGTGGLWYWINQWRDRIRIRVRLRSETFELKESPNLEVVAIYEIENIGGQITSVEPSVRVSGYTPRKDRMKISFEIEGLERDLPPFKPKIFHATFTVPAKYPFLLFRTYTFRATRGSGKKVRVWSANRRNIDFLRFHFELIRFMIFGTYEEPQT